MKEETQSHSILRTKLHRPAPPPDLVPRPRLLERLENGRQQPLILVSAPAGYGKSTLVSHWVETSACPTAWLSLDESDNDLNLFLTYLLEAVRTIFPSAGKETMALVNAPSLPPLSDLSRSLINELDSMEQDFVLVLDDYHCIQDDSVHGLMSELLRHPPQPMLLVLAGRRDPPLPITSLRARGWITEIRLPDLCFSAPETEAFLEQAFEGRIEKATSSAWAEKTEGWVTGLRLAAIALRHLGDADVKMLEVKGTVSYVMDYFLTEVIENLPPDIHDYLLRTAIMDRFCAHSCDELFGPGVESAEREINGEGFINWLKDNNMFLIPMDTENHWFRYHHLFQELLQNQLKRENSPEEIASLHSRAGVWLAENDLLEEALRHALAAGDVAFAVDLVVQHRNDLINNGDWHLLRRCLNELPPETIETNPTLLITKTMVSVFFNQYDEARSLLARAEDLGPAIPVGSPESKTIQAEIALCHCIPQYHAGEVARAVASAEKALKDLPADAHSHRGHATIILSLAHQALGEPGAGLGFLTHALESAQSLGGTFHTRIMAGISLIHFMEGDLQSTVQAATRLLELGIKHDLPESTVQARSLLGWSYYLRNELDAAEPHLEAALRDRDLANPHWFPQCAFVRALSYAARDRADEARRMVDLVIHHGMEREILSVVELGRAFESELALQQGQVAKASPWARAFQPDQPYLVYLFHIPQLTAAKVHLALDTPDSRKKATALLGWLHNRVLSLHDKRHQIDVLALQALLHNAEGDGPTAFEKLSESLTLAAPGGFIRSFVDLGPPMADLLKRLSKQKRGDDFIRNLLDAFRDDERGESPDGSDSRAPLPPSLGEQPLIEPLTHREIEILDLLAKRMYSREIADKLFISPETVKTHLRNIYQKLLVKTRREAVDEARKLGILDDG